MNNDLNHKIQLHKNNLNSTLARLIEIYIYSYNDLKSVKFIVWTI